MGQLPELSLTILDLAKSRGRPPVKDIMAISGANRNTVKNTWKS